MTIENLKIQAYETQAAQSDAMLFIELPYKAQTAKKPRKRATGLDFFESLLDKPEGLS
ncbi:MAG: hypothetical protein VKJ04_11615 [Vampirovibrionales bacterium]|nr:hypothetical protein [Vampirovibrionales bacterium]